MLDVLSPPEVIETCLADLKEIGKYILLTLALYTLKLFPPWIINPPKASPKHMYQAFSLLKL